MSDIRFNQWLHNSGTGGISQDSTGHVGIGTTVPTHINALTNNNSILHVGIVSCNTLNAASKIEGAIDDWIIHQSDPNTKFGFPTTDTFTVETAGSERLRITSAGKVGINTTTPYTALEVQGDGGVNDATITFTRWGSPANDSVIGSNFYRIGTDSVAGIGAYRESAMDDAYLAFHTQPTGGNFTERLRITSEGITKFNTTSVAGVGTTCRVQIDSSVKEDGILFGNTWTYGIIARGASNGALVYTGNAGPANLGGGTKVTHEWWSGSAGGGTPSKKMTLNTDGNLELTSGNLVFANGQGIDFGANIVGGGTSTGTVLEDYEEGTYSTTMVSSNCTLDDSSGTGYYIKVGNMVHVRGQFSLNTNDGSPAVSGSDAITQALPYTRHANGTFTGTMLQANINWGGPTSLAHPHYFNPVVADYVCQVASDGIRFYMNRIEYAYQRLTNAYVHVGYPGYTHIMWNITYQTT